MHAGKVIRLWRLTPTIYRSQHQGLIWFEPCLKWDGPKTRKGCWELRNALQWGMTSVKLGVYSNIICRAPCRAATQLTKIFFTTITTYFLIVKTKGCLPLYDSRFMTDDNLVVNVEGLHQSEKRVNDPNLSIPEVEFANQTRFIYIYCFL